MITLNKCFSPRKIRKYFSSLFNTDYCVETGFLFQKVGSQKVYLRHRREYLSPKSLDKLCTSYYYKFYQPQSNDTVVCIGAGLGHEAIWLANQVNNIRFVGIEIQPYLYELLCNTLRQINKYSACSLAIDSNNKSIFINSAINYTAVSSGEKGYIEIQTFKWNDFLSKYHIEQIDLLQINIEGAEKFLLPMISDYKRIKRIIISAHDFRANRGDGEQYRTREFVKDFLIKAGYAVTHCGPKSRQMDWMFAERIN